MFLHPWAIALGVAAVGLPWAIHLLTKPRPARLPLSTLRFVREAIQQRATRHKLRDWIVLLLRSFAVLLIAFAIARPRFGNQPLVADTGTEEAVRVVLLDVSQSMGTVQEGVERLERARTMAAAHLRFRPQLRMNLILAAATPRAVFTEPSTNAESLRTELQDAIVLPERCNVKAALSLAGKMLAPQSASDQRKRELVIVSDFQRANWAKADFAPLAKDIVIQFESVATGEAPANLAVLSARARGRSAVQGDTLLEVELGNFSRAPRKVSVDVTLGQATHRLEGNIGPSERLMLTEAVKLSHPGWQVGAATLVNLDDALAADDWRPLVVQVEPPPVYALLTRQPAAQRPSSSHYLECALVPSARAGSDAPRVVRIDPDTPDREQFGLASAVVVDHPGGLSQEAIQLLASALRNGRPVLYVASEISDANNLHKLNEVLGTSLQLPVEFVPPPDGAARRDLRLTTFRADEPPFQTFGENAKTVLGRLRFAGGLATKAREGTLADDLLASHSDGSAALVVASSERGALAVLNADLERSNLPMTPEAFVPLMQELLQLLLERQSTATEGYCGEALVARLPVTATVKDLSIRPPPKRPTGDGMGELADEGLGVVWTWPKPAARGVYQIQKQNETVFALAINLPDEESNLEGLPPDVLQTRLAAGRAVYYRSAADDPNQARDVWWTWLLAGCVVCLIGELAALVGFRT